MKMRRFPVRFWTVGWYNSKKKANFNISNQSKLEGQLDLHSYSVEDEVADEGEGAVERPGDLCPFVHTEWT